MIADAAIQKLGRGKTRNRTNQLSILNVPVAFSVQPFSAQSLFLALRALPPLRGLGLLLCSFQGLAPLATNCRPPGTTAQTKKKGLPNGINLSLVDSRSRCI